MKFSKTIVRSSIVVTILLLLAVLPSSSTRAFSEDLNNPGVGTNMGGIGSEAWVNPGEITTPGSPYASVTLFQGHRYSNYLLGNQYGFAIPSEAKILGIEVSINHRSSARNPSVVDNVVSLVKSGSIVGDNKAVVGQWPTTFTLVIYGGPTDLWGTTWTAADINSSDFGVVLAAYRNNNGNSNRNAYVDSIQVSVFYGYSASTEISCGDGSPITYGDSVTCVATVTAVTGNLTPTGTVDWTSDASGNFNPNPCILNGANSTATCSTTYTPSAVGDGTHMVTATYAGDDYFASSDGTQNVTVLKRPITVKADSQTKVFGSADPLLTYQVTSGSRVFTDTFTGTLARDPGENAGSYNITQGTLALPSSYDLTFVGDTFTITKAGPVCTVTPYNLTYDGTERLATGACTGVKGEPLTGLDLTTTAHTNAGDYTDPWTFTDTTGNYNNTSGSVNDIIGMADATCKVTGYDVTYDAISHTADGACTGIKAVTLDGLDLSGTTHTNVGSYTDPWTFTDPNDNYNNSSGTVDDRVTKRLITVTADPKTKKVGKPDPALTYQVTGSTLLSGDSFSGALTRQPGQGVGTYAILQGSLSLPDYYEITFVSANFTIVGTIYLFPFIIK